MTPEILDLALVFIVVAAAICCIASHSLELPRVYFIAKPLTMAFVIALAARPSESASDAFQGLVLAGLLFSLAGDVFLMLPSDRFVAGLGCFFVGHVCYVGAFAIDAGLTTAFLREPAGLLIFLVLGAAVYAYLWPGLSDMNIPVAVYVFAIAAMAWQATARWHEVGQLGSLLACMGAVLFLVSDSVLAVNRFRRPFAAAQVVVLGTYFPAQCLIALSVGSGEVLADWAMP